MILRAAATWIVLLILAFGFATLRVAVLEPELGEQRAHVVGTLAVVAAFAAVIWFAAAWIRPDLARLPLGIVGLSWTLATIAFEFGFGHFVMGHPWSRLLADYDLAAGRLWVFVLLTLLVMPVVAGELQRGGA